MFRKKTVLLFALTALFTSALYAQDPRMQRLIDDAEKAKTSFIATDKLMQHMFDKAYAYAILPNVGKGAAGIGGAAGSGIVYEQGKMIGSVKMKQLTVGWQVGGQAFREVIFFEDKETLERFKTNEFEFAAQTSAAAMKAENYADAEYTDGLLVFTQKKTGLMYDASIGGQKFNYDSF
jgi:lipid-binding SYLF domain-containing protein